MSLFANEFFSMLKDYGLAIFDKRSIIKSIATSAISYIGLMTIWLIPLPEDIRAIRLFHPSWWVWAFSILAGLIAAQFLGFKELWGKWHKLDVDRGTPDLILDCLPANGDGRKGMQFEFRVQNVTDQAALHVSLSAIEITTTPAESDFEIENDTLEIVPGKPQHLAIEFDELQNALKGIPVCFTCRLRGVGVLQRFDLVNALSRDEKFKLQANTYPLVLQFSDIKGNCYEIEYTLEFDYLKKSIFCRRKGLRKTASDQLKVATA